MKRWNSRKMQIVGSLGGGIGGLLCAWVGGWLGWLLILPLALGCSRAAIWIALFFEDDIPEDTEHE